MNGQTTEGNWPKNKDLATAVKLYSEGWLRVVYAHECPPCDMCEEPVCMKCEMHYAECDCPGPYQHDEYEYKGFDGAEYARRKLDVH